jgi:CRP/FNR family cyclic AMP-dependent transcriptional regulator
MISEHWEIWLKASGRGHDDSADTEPAILATRLPRRESPCNVLQEFAISSNFASSGHQLLAHSRVLGVLPPEDQARLSEQCVERQFGKNQVVYVAGASADSMLVLGSGQLKVSSYAADGTELILASVIPGETIGELGMLSGLPRSATVTATRASSGMMLPRVVVVSLIEQRPAVALAMLQNLADLTRRVSGVAADLVFLDVHQRVAKFLVNNAQGPSSTVRVTQAHLGAAVGASRQRVNMCLQDFQREGWISISSGAIRLIDPDGLAGSAAD